MSGNLDLLVGLAMGLNLIALGSSRLTTLIRAMSLQGVVLGAMPTLLGERLDGWMVLTAVATFASKGLVIPTLLRRAMRTAQIDREIQPTVGFAPSLLLGAGVATGSLALTQLLPLRAADAESLLVPGALATVLTGFVMLIGRTKAISQVCGYLILENGIYMFGLLLLRVMPVLVEAGVLLDLTVGVFVIGIIVDRIQRAFDSLDTRKLTALRE